MTKIYPLFVSVEHDSFDEKRRKKGLISLSQVQKHTERNLKYWIKRRNTFT